MAKIRYDLVGNRVTAALDLGDEPFEILADRGLWVCGVGVRWSPSRRQMLPAALPS